MMGGFIMQNGCTMTVDTLSNRVYILTTRRRMYDKNIYTDS